MNKHEQASRPLKSAIIRVRRKALSAFSDTGIEEFLELRRVIFRAFGLDTAYFTVNYNQDTSSKHISLFIYNELERE